MYSYMEREKREKETEKLRERETERELFAGIVVNVLGKERIL